MRTSPTSSTVMLRSPAAFAASLPALVGFHPSRSLVAVFLAEASVVVSMRLDLPDDLSDVAEYVAATGERVRADEVILAVYDGRGGGDLPHRLGIDAITDACQSADLSVRDAMLIDDGRLWSYLCASPDCCPPEGTAIPTESTLLEAERVGTGGLAVAPSRDEVVARFAPRPDLAPSATAREEAAAILQLPVAERAQEAWDAVKVLAADRGMDSTEPGQVLRARLQAAMAHVWVRDFVLCHVAMSTTGTDALLDVVVQAALTAPEDLRPRIAGAAAALLAACGDSSIAVDCLLDLADGESLADLVRASKNAVVAPDTLRQVFTQAFPQVIEQLRSAAVTT